MKHNLVFHLFFSIYTDILSISMMNRYYHQLHLQKEVLIYIFNQTPNWEMLAKDSCAWAKDENECGETMEWKYDDR